VFGNRVLKRIFGPVRRGETVSWRRLHNEELHNLYTSPHIIRAIKPKEAKIDGSCSTHWGEKKYIQNFSQKLWKEESG
jgi:hypothetical protein